MEAVRSELTNVNKRTVFWESTGGWFLSPLVVSLANLILVFIAAILPPDWLSRTLDAKDICFLNPNFLLVSCLSVFSFIIGIALAAIIFNQSRVMVKKSPFFQPTRLLIKRSKILAGATICGEIIVAIILIARVGPINYLLALKNPVAGTILREHIVTIARIGGVNVLATQIFFLPALIIVFFVTLSYNHNKNRVISLVPAILGLLAYCATNALTFTRWQILESVLSVIIVYFFVKNSQHGLSFNKIIKIIFYFLIFAIVIFLGINLIKTKINGTNALIGYIFGSYNNAAAVISGVIKQPFNGSTYVTLGAIWNAPLLGGSIRELGRSLGLNLPSASAGATIAWSSWSDTLRGTGLNPMYQWDTVFGAVYGDVGLFFPLVFILYGFISQCFFVKAMNLRLFHLLVYVFILVSLISWFSGVFISNTTLDDYLIFSSVLYFLFNRQWGLSILVNKRAL